MGFITKTSFLDEEMIWCTFWFGVLSKPERVALGKAAREWIRKKE